MWSRGLRNASKQEACRSLTDLHMKTTETILCWPSYKSHAHLVEDLVPPTQIAHGTILPIRTRAIAILFRTLICDISVAQPDAADPSSSARASVEFRQRTATALAALRQSYTPTPRTFACGKCVDAFCAHNVRACTPITATLPCS